MALPQKNKNTKRANDWRRNLAKEERRKHEARKVPTWESWWAQQSRLLNEPSTGFRRDVRLDPTQVRDDRRISILGSIARWWNAQHLPWDLYDMQPTGTKREFDRNTPFGKLQRSAARFKESRQPQPQAGPRPSPSPAPIIATPKPSKSRAKGGLLSQYRRK